MAKRYTHAFWRDAVRVALSSGLPRLQVSPDLGVGLSTLNKWVQRHQQDDLMSGPHEGVEKETSRLRKEVRLLREERKVLKKRWRSSDRQGIAQQCPERFICRPKLVRFSCIDAWKEVWPVELLCRIRQVTSRGVRAWRIRPMRQRQRDDMVLLAHIREQHRLSLQSYSRPCMTEELQEPGRKIGHCRIGRLMRENDIKIVRTQQYKATTDSNHTFNIMPNLLDQDFSADGPNQKWAGDISYIWTSEGWPYLAVIIDLCSRRVIGWALLGHAAQNLLGGGQKPHAAEFGDPRVGHGGGTKATTRRLHSSY